MREQLEALVLKHGYQAVLNTILVIMSDVITPKTIGFDLVWKLAKDIDQLAYKLDRVRSGEAQ